MEGSVVMARILAYQSATEGHVFPSTGMLLELERRGHEVHVRTLSSQVANLAALGLRAEPLDPRLEALELEDWRERSQVKAMKRVVEFYDKTAEIDLPDMLKAIDEVRPDALVVDFQSEGAGHAAEASGLPWATYCPYPPPIPSVDAPPHGLGLKPARGPVGRLRDRLLHAYARRFVRPHVAHRNRLRATLGLPPIEHYEDQWTAADRCLALAAEPYEYHRRDWPPSVRLVGPGTWDPPAEPPEWLAEETRPIILVTASTAYQHDEKLIVVALEAFADEDVALVVTTAATDPSQFAPPPNARLEAFLPHGPIIERAACVVCHGGQGTTQKALAAGVPVCVVPFCRDQFDVARRVEATDSGTWLHHKKLTPGRLRAKTREAMGKREGAQRVARGSAAAGGSSAPAAVVEELISDGFPPARASSARASSGR